MVTPENNKFIFSRISFELAEAIKKAPENKLHMDDALIIAATPTVLLNYKSLEDLELKKVMLSMKRFLKRNPRFLEFKKDAVKEGLIEEWLPNIENDDKIGMLSDFALTPGVTDDGYIIYNPQVLANLTKTEHPDHEIYGKEEYTKRITRKDKSLKNKVLLKTIEPDKELETKLKPYIDWYKKNWEWIHPRESYKWEGVKHFQENFNLDSKDLPYNLKESFKKAGNLLSGSMYTPLSMLIKYCNHNTEEVREALRNLFDEDKPLYERSLKFLSDLNEIHKVNQEKGYFRPTDHTQQSDRATSVYLAFRYPNRHFLFKTSVWNDFKTEVELDYPSVNQFVGKLYGYERMADHIREVLIRDTELMDLLKKSEPEDMSDGHLLTQDFMYAIATYY